MTRYFITQNGEMTFKRKIRRMGKMSYLTIPKELGTMLGAVEYQVTLKPLK